MKEKLYKIRASLRSMLPFLPIIWFTQTCLVDTAYINTRSMAPTLEEGTLILHTPLPIGAKTPETLCAPFLPGTWGLYLSDVQLPSWRIPPMSRLKRGHIMTFHDVDHTNDTPINCRQVLAGRLVAVGGDIVDILRSKVYINGFRDPYETYRTKTLHFYVREPLATDLLDRYTTSWRCDAHTKDRHEYTLEMRSDQLEQYELITEGKAVLKANGNRYERGIPFQAVSKRERKAGKEDPGTVAQFKVPERGMTISLDVNTHPLYIKAIQNTERDFLVEKIEKKEEDKSEEGKWIKVEQEGVKVKRYLIKRHYLEGKLIREYTFTTDYAFVIGDQFHHARDSRQCGPIPKSHWLGVAFAKLLNWKHRSRDHWFRGLLP